MLQLRPRALPRRFAKFYRARCRMLRERPEFFCTGMCLPDGTWLSILSGWRHDRVTHVDLQRNGMCFKKESLSAVMRAFMLQHEIASKQQLIDFVGGTSLFREDTAVPSSPAPTSFSGGLACAPPPRQNGFPAPQTGQHLRTRKETNRIIRTRLHTKNKK
jgi:hypothetical protein